MPISDIDQEKLQHFIRKGIVHAITDQTQCLVLFEVGGNGSIVLVKQESLRSLLEADKTQYLWMFTINPDGSVNDAMENGRYISF